MEIREIEQPGARAASLPSVRRIATNTDDTHRYICV